MDTNIPNDYEGLLHKFYELKNSFEYRQAIGNEFIERMHYDFNTLLNSITGYLYAIYDNADQAQKPAIDSALKTSTTLLNKFNDMTDYISLILGGYVSEKAPVSLRLIMRQVNQNINDVLSARNINFKCEFDDEIPEYVETDYVIVKKVLSLLLENALQNTPSETINVYISFVSKESDSIKIKFSVSDDGGVIDIDKMNRLLNGLVPVDGGSAAGGMHGFGLQMARDFLGLLGSSLTAENNVSGGSTLTFVLDVTEIAAENLSIPAAESEADGKALSDVSVLLADDSVIMQQIVKQMLVNEGAAVTLASNGEEAVSAFSENRFSVVLMDIEMPTLNGYEAASKITSIKAERNISTPVIGMTAHTGREERDRCIESGMASTLTKPFNLKDLMDAIYKELYNKEYIAAEEEQALEKSSVFNFEKIKGIDFKEGVRRLGGNEKVYFELLQNFRDGYSDVASNISSLLMEGNDNEVKSLLHLIKGISGNLSFNEIYNYANKLKDAVDHDDIVEITNYLKLFGDALSEFRITFEEAEVEMLYNMSEMVDMDLLLVKTRLKELLEYLSGDVDLGNAMDACNDVYDYMKETGDKKDFERIKDALGAFDLELAETLLKSFISKYS